MALDLRDSVAIRNARLDAITTFAGVSARLRLYSGTKPANAAGAITGTLLVELVCNATAFAAAAASGVLTANAITNGTGTAGAGAGTTATHFRLFKTDGTTVVFDGTVGNATSDLILDNTNIATGQTVSVTSFTRTAGNA